jgi:hypothetical protein
LTTVPRSILHFHSHLSSSHLFFLSDQQPMISTINHRPNHSLDLILTPHRFRSHIYMHQCKSLVFCLQFFIAVINIFFLLWFLFFFFFFSSCLEFLVLEYWEVTIYLYFTILDYSVWERGANCVPQKFKFFLLKNNFFICFKSFWYADLKIDFKK